MKVVIMAGGFGTRIREIAPDVPKPMIRIEGVPVLEREILSLKEQGFTDFILTVSYLREKIIEGFGDGSRLGVNIEYFEENEPLGSAGALFRLKSKLTEDFLLLNADAVFDIDFNRFVKYHQEKNALVTLFAHPNSHPYDSGLLITDGDGAVKEWLSKTDERPEFYRNLVNAGLHVISPRVLEMAKERVEGKAKIDLDKDLLKPLSGKGVMFAYESPEYVKDMGTPERFNQVADDIKKGIVSARNLKNKQRAVFLDRDGVLNREVGFCNNTEEFELLPWTASNIRKINRSGYLAVVVTNQPVIARGEMSLEELSRMHKKLETELGKEGAYLDAIYFCPHHPDSGFEGEVKELKIVCDCRKPKPGMLLRAAERFNIDLSQSVIVGDSRRDIEAGEAAGCRTFLVKTNEGWDADDVL
ncbi:MAG: HAD-IIIA family hydrolase [Eubacteriales bacterium]|nr:HAD-IIIA family hydrolase [Eubacteriales bacterium]